MPTYDYKCLNCDHKFTVFIAIKEKDNVRCPICKSDKISEIYSAAGIAIKNSGQSSYGCGSNSGGIG